MPEETTSLILIAIAKDAGTYDDFQTRLDVIGAKLNIVEVPPTAMPKNTLQAIAFAEEMKPYFAPIFQKVYQNATANPGQMFSARIFEVALVKSPTT